MAKGRSTPSTITFGDWRLVGNDSQNWELCHRHETADTRTARANGTVGKVRWHHVGRYYTYSTLAYAIAYAADCEGRNSGFSMELREYADWFDKRVDALRDDLLASLRGE